jgi:hypothetical protein
MSKEDVKTNLERIYSTQRELGSGLLPQPSKKASIDLSVPPPPLTPPPMTAVGQGAGNGSNSLNNNRVLVETGGNLSGNKVDALSNNDIDPDNNRTIIYLCSCFNAC